MSVAPARVAAYTVLRRVFEQDAFADRALHTAAAGLEPRDRALATVMAYGTVQRRRTLDHLLQGLSSRPLERLEPAVLAALRLGVYQLVFLGGVSDYAAVNDSVELAKRESRAGASLVNAVLRRASRESPGRFAALADASPRDAALCHSVPDWVAELWWAQLGPDQARKLLATVNEPAESALRVNWLRSGVEAVRAALPAGCAARAAPAWSAQPGLPELPEVLVLDGPYDAFGSELFTGGALMPQARSSAVVARVLDPQPGERVADLCAAPGAKTTHLAALMRGEGELVAVERQAGRARALAQSCLMMGAAHVRVVELDARSFRDEQGFDRVLLDPPCSGLGTLQSRPDLRWQRQRGDLAALIATQRELLERAGALLRPGGTLVYSVCTISSLESDQLLAGFLSANAEFELDRAWQILPHVEHTDGFYIARLRRRGGAR